MGQKIDFQLDIERRPNEGDHDSGAAGIRIIAAQFAQINYSLGSSLLSVATRANIKTGGWASFWKDPEKY